MAAAFNTVLSLLSAVKVIKISFAEVVQEFCGALKYENGLTTSVWTLSLFRRAEP